MIGYKQMEKSVLSCFGTMIYIFPKLVIKNLKLHYSILFHCVTSKSTSFGLRKVEKSFPPLLKSNVHISTKKNVHLFKKHKFYKPNYIHKSFVQCLHLREVSVPVPVTAIYVVSSPLFISSNISKPILVSASTVSVISDVTMQSVNVTSVRFCRSICRNERRAFFMSTIVMMFVI